MNLEAAIRAIRERGAATRPGWSAEREVVRAITRHPGLLYALGERRRQVEKCGWTAEKDDAEPAGNLIDAAMAILEHGRLLLTNGTGAGKTPPAAWPWGAETWNPTITPEDAFVKAMALVAAELDRMGRLAERETRAAQVDTERIYPTMG